MGPLVTAASISYGVQSRPTKTGHLTRAYCSNKFSALCRLVLYLENTRPRNFPWITPSGPVKSSSNRRRSSANSVTDQFFHQCRETLSRFGVGCTAAVNVLDSRFFYGWRQVESARPTCVLNSMLGTADGWSDLS